jgi:hypothetical protein
MATTPRKRSRGKLVLIACRVPKTLQRTINARARAARRTQSDYLRMLLTDVVKRDDLELSA